MRNTHAFSLGVVMTLTLMMALPAAAQSAAAAERTVQTTVPGAATGPAQLPPTQATSPGAPAGQVRAGLVPVGSGIWVSGGRPAGRAYWEALNDTTLNRLLDRAMDGNLDLRTASARLDGAGASRLEAALDLTPSVTASAGYTRRRLAASSFPAAPVRGALLPWPDDAA